MTLQTQPTATSCGHTCLAMALNVPAEDVIAWLGEDPLTTQSLLQALSECRFTHAPLLYSSFVFTGWHFVTAPSRTFERTMHQLLVHYDSTTGAIRVLDPAPGIKYAEDGSDLFSWSEPVWFHPDGKLPQSAVLQRIAQGLRELDYRHFIDLGILTEERSELLAKLSEMARDLAAA